jgi:predicted MFS family arabinose efflux permease
LKASFVSDAFGHKICDSDRLWLTGVMLASLILIAVAPNFLVLMIARALLGVVVGGFWSLSTATEMRLVPEETVPKALGIIYTGLAVASAFAAPIGSYVGGIIGWRGVFWAMTPLAVVTLICQWLSLPSMEPQTAKPVGKLFWLLKRRHIAFAMAGVMLTYAGVFASFTYLRPFLESYTHVSLPQLSLLLLGLGLARFAGTYGASALVGRHLFSLLCGLPMALAAVTIGLPAPAPLWLYMAAIERGLHVLCEKSLAMTSAEARRLTDAAEAAGLVTMCPFTYRFMPVALAEGARR